MANLDWIDLFKSGEIVCPLCEKNQSEPWEVLESGEIDCEHCEEEFYVEVEHYVRYTTSQI